MVRPSARSKRGRVGKKRGGGRRSNRERTPTAAQLDFEMELLKAKREGREEEFRKENVEKRRAARKKNLDDDMDDYFKSRKDPKEEDKKDDEETTEDAPKDAATEVDPNQDPSADGDLAEEEASEPNK